MNAVARWAACALWSALAALELIALPIIVIGAIVVASFSL